MIDKEVLDEILEDYDRQDTAMNKYDIEENGADLDE